jgi:ATP/ADP translocase
MHCQQTGLAWPTLPILVCAVKHTAPQFLGWRGAALATPLVMLASGAIFFGAALFPAAAGGGPLPSPVLAALLALGPLAGLVAQVGVACARP